MAKAISKTYFQKQPRPSSEDGLYQAVSNGKIGFFEGRYVDIKERRYISEKKADIIIAREVHILANNPSFLREEDKLAKITDGGCFHRIGYRKTE